MMGSQMAVQKPTASRQPNTSPISHTQQLERLSHLSRQAQCAERVRVMAGLMRQPALGAKERAMWQKMAMLMYPESSLSMKVVLGLDRRRVNSTKMKTPIVSLARIRNTPPYKVSSSIFVCPKTSLMASAAIAPTNCAGRYSSSIFPLYMLSFLRQLDSVMTGLMLAPQRPAHIHIATSSIPAACRSLGTKVTEQRYPKVKRKTARHSNTMICRGGASFMMLYLSCSNRLMVLSLRLFDALNSFSSYSSKSVRFIYSLTDMHTISGRFIRQQYHFRCRAIRERRDSRYCFQRDRREKRTEVLSCCLELGQGGMVQGEEEIRLWICWQMWLEGGGGLGAGTGGFFDLGLVMMETVGGCCRMEDYSVYAIQGRERSSFGKVALYSSLIGSSTLLLFISRSQLTSERCSGNFQRDKEEVAQDWPILAASMALISSISLPMSS